MASTQNRETLMGVFHPYSITEGGYYLHTNPREVVSQREGGSGFLCDSEWVSELPMELKAENQNRA